MEPSLKIGNILIGKNERPLVIPEIGINHEGSLEVAKKMVDAACRAGARLIKHQTHIVEDEMCQAAQKVIPGNSDKSIFDIMNRCALSEEDEYELMCYTKSKGMVYLSTPFSRMAADRLERFGILAYKIGSGEMNNHPLIRHIAAFGKPMIVSTGMNNLEQVKKTVAILEDYHVNYALLHTTNLYPTDPSLIRLGAMQEMMNEFPNVPVGLSDHSLNNTACIAAMALGASIVERHFTDTKERPGPDIVCSMDEKDLKDLLEAASDIPKMLGGHKNCIDEEEVTRNFAYATIVSIKPIKTGETFTKDNLWVKRPGVGGILAENFESVLGKKAKIDIPNNIQITWDMII